MGEISVFPHLSDVVDLVEHGYVPFADIERAIPFPSSPEVRNENDAEHSFMLSLVAGAVAERIGLNTGKTCQLAIVHDFVEVFAGDVSIWDKNHKNKKVKEAEALETIKSRWPQFPWLWNTIEDYEKLESAEACLVYALDKLLATIMVTLADGYFWKQNEITFDAHRVKVEEIRSKIARHPVVLGWYEELLVQIEARQTQLFAQLDELGSD